MFLPADVDAWAVTFWHASGAPWRTLGASSGMGLPSSISIASGQVADVPMRIDITSEVVLAFQTIKLEQLKLWRQLTSFPLRGPGEQTVFQLENAPSEYAVVLVVENGVGVEFPYQGGEKRLPALFPHPAGTHWGLCKTPRRRQVANESPPNPRFADAGCSKTAFSAPCYLATDAGVLPIDVASLPSPATRSRLLQADEAPGSVVIDGIVLTEGEQLQITALAGSSPWKISEATIVDDCNPGNWVIPAALLAFAEPQTEVIISERLERADGVAELGNTSYALDDLQLP